MVARSNRSPLRTAVTRAVIIAGALFLLAVAALTAGAWFSSDDDRNLPFGYEGFDQQR
jgi:hypothetical protein